MARLILIEDSDLIKGSTVEEGLLMELAEVLEQMVEICIHQDVLVFNAIWCTQIILLPHPLHIIHLPLGSTTSIQLVAIVDNLLPQPHQCCHLKPLHLNLLKILFGILTMEQQITLLMI